jgi:putative transposase
MKEFSAAVGASERAIFYWRAEVARPALPLNVVPKIRAPPPNKLSAKERRSIINVLCRPAWIDFSPIEIYYKLLDEEGIVMASISTFYRIARSENLLTKRSKTDQVGTKLNREKPHLVALAPNEIWSWDVSQIKSTLRTQRYYLYVIIDIWSRYVVGWRIEDHEQSDHAIGLWKDALEAQSITGVGLTNHKDNGAIMTSHEMIQFVKDTQMIDSYSRAGVSDDNPFSEAFFRTIKYFRNFPEMFASLEEARIYFKKYFSDYNDEFRHSGIQFISPVERHFGEEATILTARNRIIKEYYAKQKHRYSNLPKIFEPIKEVRIN